MASGQYQPDAKTISDYQRDGAVCIRGAFKEWVDTIAAGIKRNMRNKSPTGSDIVQDGKGSFFDDYCNWERIEIREGGAGVAVASIAAGMSPELRSSFTTMSW